MTGTLRKDLQIIADMVDPGTTLLDVGCGEGDLLVWLQKNRNVSGRGIELSEDGVNRCIARGLSVIQGDAETDLEHYPTQAYDYVVLSQTLQNLRDPRRTLEELLRIARHAIVSVPNFGHWRNRLYLAVNGRMPVTKTLPYEWYNTPNIHFCTITDFVCLADELGLVIEKRLFVTNQGAYHTFVGQGHFANLFGEQGIFMLRK